MFPLQFLRCPANPYCYIKDKIIHLADGFLNNCLMAGKLKCGGHVPHIQLMEAATVWDPIWESDVPIIEFRCEFDMSSLRVGPSILIPMSAPGYCWILFHHIKLECWKETPLSRLQVIIEINRSKQVTTVCFSDPQWHCSRWIIIAKLHVVSNFSMISF